MTYKAHEIPFFIRAGMACPSAVQVEDERTGNVLHLLEPVGIVNKDLREVKHIFDTRERGASLELVATEFDEIFGGIEPSPIKHYPYLSKRKQIRKPSWLQRIFRSKK